MKTPRYTDDRYPNGYRKSVNTNLAATFKRIRAEQKEAAEKRDSKVQPIVRGKAA